MRSARMHAYRNLHHADWTVTLRGRKVLGAPAIVMHDCELRVREGGRQKVIQQKKKNVHAFVVGDIADGKGGTTAFFEQDAMACSYNPYRTNCFYLKDQPELGVTHAERVLLDSNGKMWVSGVLKLKQISDAS